MEDDEEKMVIVIDPDGREKKFLKSEVLWWFEICEESNFLHYHSPSRFE